MRGQEELGVRRPRVARAAVERCHVGAQRGAAGAPAVGEEVIVIADPYVTSLDGLPNIDICLDDIRAKKRIIKTEWATEDNKLKKSSNI